jgi:hypothetical protein
MMGGDFYMGGNGLLWFVIIGALIIIPFWRLLPQFGIPSWVAIFTLFPLVALILLWIMAFKDRMNA